MAPARTSRLEPSFILSSTYVIYGGQNVSANALVGTSADDVLVGTGNADRIITGQGNDTLMGSGSDVLRGGVGDDILAISDTAFVRLDGGSGIDTLRFDTALTLNFVTNRYRITGVEKIDLSAEGENTSITLNLSDSSTSSDSLSIYI